MSPDLFQLTCMDQTKMLDAFKAVNERPLRIGTKVHYGTQKTLTDWLEQNTFKPPPQLNRAQRRAAAKEARRRNKRRN